VVETMPITKGLARRESPRTSARIKATVGATTTKGPARRDCLGISAKKRQRRRLHPRKKRNNKRRRRNKNKRTRRSKKRRRMRATTVHSKNAVRIAL
jgi:hypothetical protein